MNCSCTPAPELDWYNTKGLDKAKAFYALTKLTYRLEIQFSDELVFPYHQEALSLILSTEGKKSNKINPFPVDLMFDFVFGGGGTHAKVLTMQPRRHEFNLWIPQQNKRKDS